MSQKKQKPGPLDSNLEGHEMANKSKIRKMPEINGGPSKSDLDRKTSVSSSDKQFMSQETAPIIGQLKGNLLPTNDTSRAPLLQTLSNYNTLNGNPDVFKQNEQQQQQVPSNTALVNQQLKESLQQIVNTPTPQVANPNNVISQPMGPNMYQMPSNFAPYNPYTMPPQMPQPNQFNPYGVYPPGFTPWNANVSPYYQFNAIPNWGMQVQYPYPHPNVPTVPTDQSQFYPQGLPYSNAPPNFNQQPLLMPMMNNNPNIALPGTLTPNSFINKPQDPSLNMAIPNPNMKEVFPMNPMNQNPYQAFKPQEQPTNLLLASNTQPLKEEMPDFAKKFVSAEANNVDRFLK